MSGPIPTDTEFDNISAQLRDALIRRRATFEVSLYACTPVLRRRHDQFRKRNGMPLCRHCLLRRVSQPMPSARSQYTHGGLMKDCTA